MNKLTLKGHEVLNGLKENNFLEFSHISDYLDKLHHCFEKNGNISIENFDRLCRNYNLDIKKIISSSCSYTRFLGYITLLYRGDTTELLWTAFEDPFFPIRLQIIIDFISPNRHKLFNEIFKHFTKDPRFVIRKAALSRLKEDFSDLFSYRIENLTVQDQLNIIPLLNVDNSHDRKILKDFVNSPSTELSSMAVYFLQKEQPRRSLSFFSRASKLSLLRYSSLQTYGQRVNTYFLKAFSYVTSKVPLGLQDDFLHELSQLTPSNDNRDSYIHAISLIKERADPFCSQRLEELLFNNPLYQLLGPDLIQSFSQRNQFQTFPLLLKLLKNETNPSMMELIINKAKSFQIPLPKEYNR